MIHSSKQLKPLPPGRFGLPILGESIAYLRDPARFMQQRQQQYGNIFKTHLFGRPTIALMGADAVRFLFANEGQRFEMTNTPSFETLLGTSSIGVKTGNAHQRLRKQLFQAFQPRLLAEYAVTMEAITQRYLQKWERLGELTWYPELKQYTLDIAYKLLVGVDTAADASLGTLYENWSNGLLSVPLRFPGSKFDRAVRSREQLLARIDTLIEQRQKQPSPQQDVLGILLQAQDEAGNDLSQAEVRDNVLALLIAGHETLTSALTSLCLFLAQAPEVLQMARAEQARLGLTEPLTQEHLKQMTYLEQVLKEVLRMAPPVVRSGQRKVLESCGFGGYAIPKGWDVFYQIQETHQDPNTFPQPDRFDPNRFELDRAEDKKAFSHIPFGGGIRECLGKEFARLEMKLFAAQLIREYEWELLPDQNLERVVLPFSRPRDGLKVKIWRRQ
jgi:cytochrome P450